MSANESHVRRTYELARNAAADGNEPFGALLVHDGSVVAESENSVAEDADPTAHPELKLARRAARELGPEERATATLYASTEPCAMCAGAVRIVGIGRVVYGVDAGTAREASPPDGACPANDVLANSDVTVVGPVLPEEGRAVHEDCW